MLLEMAERAMEKITQCDLEWNHMQDACWGSALDETDLEFTVDDLSYKIPRVQEMRVMENEADTVSAMRHRMRTATSATMADMYFDQDLGSVERRKHERYNQVVQGQLVAHVGNMDLDERTGRHAAWL